MLVNIIVETQVPFLVHPRISKPRSIELMDYPDTSPIIFLKALFLH